MEAVNLLKVKSYFRSSRFPDVCKSYKDEFLTRHVDTAFLVFQGNSKSNRNYIWKRGKSQFQVSRENAKGGEECLLNAQRNL